MIHGGEIGKLSKFRGSISFFLLQQPHSIHPHQHFYHAMSRQSFLDWLLQMQRKSCLSAHSHLSCLSTGMKATCQAATWWKNHLRICKCMSKLCLCFSCTLDLKLQASDAPSPPDIPPWGCSIQNLLRRNFPGLEMLTLSLLMFSGGTIRTSAEARQKHCSGRR